MEFIRQVWMWFLNRKSGIFSVCCRVVVARVLSMYGRPVMVAQWETTVAVMVMYPVFTRCLSAASRTMVWVPTSVKSVRQPSPSYLLADPTRCPARRTTRHRKSKWSVFFHLAFFGIWGFMASHIWATSQIWLHCCLQCPMSWQRVAVHKNIAVVAIHPRVTICGLINHLGLWVEGWVTKCKR